MQVGSIYIDVAHWLLVIVMMVVMVFVLVVVVVFGLMPLFIVQQVPFDLFIRDLPPGTLIAMAVSMIVSMSMTTTTTVLMSVMPMIVLVLPSQMIVSLA